LPLRLRDLPPLARHESLYRTPAPRLFQAGRGRKRHPHDGSAGRAGAGGAHSIGSTVLAVGGRGTGHTCRDRGTIGGIPRLDLVRFLPARCRGAKILDFFERRGIRAPPPRRRVRTTAARHLGPPSGRGRSQRRSGREAAQARPMGRSASLH